MNRTMRSIVLAASVAMAASLAAAPSPATAAGSRLGASSGADGVWQPIPPMSPRYEHAAVYDPVRHQMLVFGGLDVTPDNAVWALSLDDAPEWNPVATLGVPPAARGHHSAIYDPVRDRMIVFGGDNIVVNSVTSSGSVLGDVWALSLSGTPTWTQLQPSGIAPGARRYHSATYDPVRDRMIVFGGWDDTRSQWSNEVWTLSFGDTLEWSLLATAGAPPMARGEHSAVYDQAHDRLIVFGGGQWSYQAPLNDVWVLSLTDTPTWIMPVIADPRPTPRADHTAIYDPQRARMIVLGGEWDRDTATGMPWVLELGDSLHWSPLAPSGQGPEPLDGHAAIYDPIHDRMVVAGGAQYGNGDMSVDTWSLALAPGPAWTLLSPSAKPWWRRSGHAAAYDPVGDRMVVVGGVGKDLWLNDAWALPYSRPQDREAIVPTGPAPSPREAHSLILDPKRHRLLLFGGYSHDYSTGTTSWFDDVWALSLDAPPAWIPILPEGAPPPARAWHTAVYDPSRDRMIVFGGLPTANDAWALSLAGTPRWTPVPAVVPAEMPQFTSHAAIYDPPRDRMIVFGCPTGSTNEVWALSFVGDPSWTQLVPRSLTTGPHYRTSPTAIYDPLRDRMIVFGGSLSSCCAVFNDTWALDLAGPPAWTQLAPAGPLPGARFEHSAVYDPIHDRMLIFGGLSNDAWALSFSGAWVGAPQPPPPGLPALSPAHPNPARGAVALEIELRQETRVTLRVHDVSGRVIATLADRTFGAGSSVVRWDGRTREGTRAAAGVYFVRLVAGGDIRTRRVVLLE